MTAFQEMALHFMSWKNFACDYGKINQNKL